VAKIKLTKNELKLQRDALRRFERYLPTLQLKKQQLQLEVRQGRKRLAEQRSKVKALAEECLPSQGLFAMLSLEEAKELLHVESFSVGNRNIAGIDVPVFQGLELTVADYDLFEAPIWLDDALQLLRRQAEARLKLQLLEEQLGCLEDELRVVSQRVNLFEKVKIPDAQENIRRINIYIGDQQTNSVGRSKIAKAKCQSRDAAATTTAEDVAAAVAAAEI